MGTTAVDRYVADLAKDLPGLHGARAAAMDEIRDGLHEAIAARTAGGVSPTVAEQAAVADLGPPATVARAFASELATMQARRTLLAFLITGPLVGVWWLLVFAPHPWPPSPDTLWAAVPILPLIGAGVATAVIILSTTGSLIRWLPEAGPRRALLAATGVAIGCLAGDLVVLSTLAARVFATDWHPALALAAAAIVASLIRIPFAGWAVLDCGRSLRRLRMHATP